MRRITAVLVLSVAFGCGTTPKNEGDQCVASSECATGLICDFAADPHVCHQVGSGVIPDAEPGAPDAGPAPDSTPGAPDARPPDAMPLDAGPPDA